MTLKARSKLQRSQDPKHSKPSGPQRQGKAEHARTQALLLLQHNGKPGTVAHEKLRDTSSQSCPMSPEVAGLLGMLMHSTEVAQKFLLNRIQRTKPLLCKISIHTLIITRV